MSKIIDINSAKNSSLQKTLIRVDFQKSSVSELYLSTTEDDLVSQKVLVSNVEDSKRFAEIIEMPYDGGYNIVVSNKPIFLDYAQALELYVALDRMYKLDRGINKLEEV
jgi:hypothetical protein